MSDVLKKLVILGAGGHSKVIIDIFHNNNIYDIVGMTDGSNDKSKQFNGIKVIGDDRILPELLKSGVRHAFVAIGDNRLRANLIKFVDRLGFEVVNAISSFSCISNSVKLDKGIAIMAGTVINADVCIGNGVIVNTGSTVDHDCNLHDYCHVAPGCNLSGNVDVGVGTFLGTGVKAIPGVSVGQWSLVGAGGVIVNNIPDNCLAVGLPARVKKKLSVF